MADALVSLAQGKLTQVLGEQVELFVGATVELKRLEKTLQSIEAVLADAEIRQVAEKNVQLWLSRLRDVAYDIDNLLDEWLLISSHENEADDGDNGNKVCACLSFLYDFVNRAICRYKVARQIEEIRERLDQIDREKNSFNFSASGSSSGDRMPVGSRRRATARTVASLKVSRKDEKEEMISKLVSGEDGQVDVIGIVGIGGLGKTTLAQEIYNDVKVRDHFKDALYWVHVSQDFDVISLTKAILEQAKKASTSLSGVDSLQNELFEALRGKRFLLVLDDVWNGELEKWKALRVSFESGAQGSKILITTRSYNVAKIMDAAYIHDLKALSDVHSWKLFSSRAFDGMHEGERMELESVGIKMARKCKGVPLYINVVGSAMNFKKTRADWQHILDSKLWSLPEVSKNILPALMLSYYNLPPHLKPCFAYCSIFGKDDVVDMDEVVKLWVAQGFIQPQGFREMEDIGEEYFAELVKGSMFENVGRVENKIRYKMHDHLHDLAELITENERYSFTNDKSKQCPANVRHASFILSKNNPTIPIASEGAKKLRTLALHGVDEIGEVPVDLFRLARSLRTLWFKMLNMKTLPGTIGKLKHLRYLNLSGSDIVQLPDSIGKLKCLKYLNLSSSRIVVLPESVSHLHSLHTLNLNFCRQLKSLPSGLGRMVSLGRLEIAETDSLQCLPTGLGRITSLRTLDKFTVGGEGGCKIDELQNLDSLQGSLEIDHLERVSSGEEARKAELRNKQGISILVLKMEEEIVTSGEDDAEIERRMDSVLEALRPHDYLRELELHCYANSMLPSWIECSNLLLLTKLVIQGFIRCEHLPGLGKLLALEYLEIHKVGVRKMGHELYYGNSSRLAGRSRKAFPKLERLKICNMSKLEEWQLTLEADAKVMPSLHVLQVLDCPNLEELPHHLASAPLTELLIQGCHRIKGMESLETQVSQNQRASRQARARLADLHLSKSDISDSDISDE